MAAVKGRPVVRKRAVGLRNKAWWVIRRNKHMTLAEMLQSICDGTEKDPAINLRRWLNKLVDAGILARDKIQDGKPNSNGSYDYRLVKNLGSKAPVLQHSKGVVFDPNSGDTYPISVKSGDL